jgi:hypothetical protein
LASRYAAGRVRAYCDADGFGGNAGAWHRAAEHRAENTARLLHEAKLPRMKTLEAFEFDRSGVSAGQLRTLAEATT